MKLMEALGLPGQDRQMVCFVGAGGKSSLILRLAEELVYTGRSVLVTTTTKMWAGQLREAVSSPDNATPPELIVEEEPEGLLNRLTELSGTTGIITAAAEIREDGKALGLTADVVDQIYSSNLFDFILIEADGSRGKSLKVPEEKEPVLPKSCTIVVPVAGVDVIGRPLTGEYAHRYQALAEAAGQVVGSTITEKTISKALEVYVNLVRNVDMAGTTGPEAEVVVILNKADTEREKLLARQTARLVLDKARGKVLVTSLKGTDPVLEVVM